MINGQDYLISFTGSGGSTTIDSVKVDNLIRGTSVTLIGNQKLHLVGDITGISETVNRGKGRISIYPNPMQDNSRIRFYLPESGDTRMTVYDVSGKQMLISDYFLIQGEHTFLLSGIGKGIYFVSVRCGRYSLSERLISNRSTLSAVKIEYETTSEVKESVDQTKGSETDEVEMKYSEGERLKYTAWSGNFSTVLTVLPESSQVVSVSFIACTDKDNNSYPIVKIGSQVWMAENLRTTKYSDGTPIDYPHYLNSWQYNTSGGYTWYDYDPSNKDIFGALYNWYAVNTGLLCPTGWHVPNDAEWTQLSDFLGDPDMTGTKLKDVGTYLWNSPNAGTNETGFTAIGAGEIHYQGNYYYKMIRTFFWTSTAETDTKAWYRDIYHNYPWLNRNNTYKNYGFSVRCIKDS